MNRNTASSLWARLLSSFRHRKDIDVLLDQAPAPDEPLKQRIDWLFFLLEWIRRTGTIKNELDFQSGAPQAARTRYILHLLDRNPQWKSKVSQTLRSIIRDTKGLELFLQTGLANQDHLGAELIERIQEKILPQVPQDEELSFIFGQNFKSPQDMEWLQLLDHKTLARIFELFQHQANEENKNWNSLKDDCDKAMLLLSIQVQGIGTASDIRKRLSQADFQQLPFFKLPRLVEQFVSEPDRDMKNVLGDKVQKMIDECRLSLAELHDHLDEQGVSIQIVYKMERLERILKRISVLLKLELHQSLDPGLLSQFLEGLISENIQQKSVLNLFNQNFSLLSRKIAERAGETGAHYITRTKAEFLQMIKSALGGGVITAFTTLVKFSVYGLKLTSFYSGFFASLNYSISFLIIHFSHFTLGTKQPSLTAAALASKMNENLEDLVDEIIHLIRSQVAAILGNVIGVVPVIIAIHWIFYLTLQKPLLSEATAQHVLHDFSILGPTPLYAAFTGVLLWLSSVFSGWVDNWFVLHKISPALAANRRLNFIFGAVYSRALALFLRRNILGIAANISLGFLLGLSPALLQFFGIQLDVRHVTLSSGALAAAVMSLEGNVFGTLDFWLAVIGIVSMGILNVGVSFSLALLVAVKARKIKAPRRKLIYRAVIFRLVQKPFSLFWPDDLAPEKSPSTTSQER